MFYLEHENLVYGIFRLSHTIFNLFGVIWALIFFKPFLALIGVIIEAFGLPNPASEGFVVSNSTSPNSTAALYGLSMLHTLFNTFNTFILVWFVKYIEKIVVWIIKTPKQQNDEVFRLKYISAGHVATPELATEQAFDEIIHFAHISKNGLQYAKKALSEQYYPKFEELRTKLVKYEEISDRIEYEIATFLNSIPVGDISEATSVKIKTMYKIISELESLGDSGEAISRILSRRNIHKKSFSDDTVKNLLNMADAVDDAYCAMIENLEAAHNETLSDIMNAYNCENRINELRNKLRDTEIEAMESGEKSYQSSVYYMDIVNEFERMGDFIINISQDLEKSFTHK